MSKKLKAFTTLLGANADGKLLELLQKFQDDTNHVSSFGEIDDRLVADAVAAKQARSRLIWSLVGSLIMAFLNGMLLYLFFSEFESGTNIPFTEIDMVVFLPALLPAGEFMAGFFSEFYSDDGSKSILNRATTAFILFGLGAFEYLIFFLLFNNLFDTQEFTEYRWIVVPLLALVGPGLTLLQASIGAGAGRALRMLSQARTHLSIKEQTRRANQFVAGLPRRYRSIAEAARAASEAIDRLLADYQRKAAANAPMIAALEEQRNLLTSAIDGVDPSKWPADRSASEDERWDIARLAWVLPFGFLVTLGAFIWVLMGVMRRAGIFSADSVWQLSAAGAAGVFCFVAGSLLYNRIGVATQHDGDTQDVIFPRDMIIQRAGIGMLGILLAAIGGSALLGGGARGAIIASLTSGLGLGLSIMGSYHDLLWRGTVFAGLSILAVGPLILTAAINILQRLTTGILCVAVVLVWVASFVIGFPLIGAYWLYKELAR